jgi:hypothetical protein
MIWRYYITANATAQTLPRVVNFFAQQDILPERVLCRCVDNEQLLIIVNGVRIDRHRAETIAEKLHSAVLVRSVRLSYI